ncbi:MAG TPA: orotate phosphoribosyltransferase [Candidatus Altiarchaeales archaeon]|nr:orotate phosphoribosyltransferase [Candidatus Altiarchaeales archaeon]
MLTGICDICGNTGILNTCMLCGRRVCSKCFIPEKGICKICLRGRSIE